MRIEDEQYHDWYRDAWFEQLISVFDADDVHTVHVCVCVWRDAVATNALHECINIACYIPSL